MLHEATLCQSHLRRPNTVLSQARFTDTPEPPNCQNLDGRITRITMVIRIVSRVLRQARGGWGTGCLPQ